MKNWRYRCLLGLCTLFGACTFLFDSQEASLTDASVSSGDGSPATNDGNPGELSFCDPVSCAEAPFLMNHFESSDSTCPQGRAGPTNASACYFDNSCAEFVQGTPAVAVGLDLDLFTGYVTFSAWVNPVASEIVIAPISLSNGLQCVIRLAVEGPVVKASINGELTAEVEIADGCWNHVAVVVPINSPELAFLQVNGGARRGTSDLVSCSPSDSDWKINFGTAYRGRIDDVSVFPQAQIFYDPGNCPMTCN